PETAVWAEGQYFRLPWEGAEPTLTVHARPLSVANGLEEGIEIVVGGDVLEAQRGTSDRSAVQVKDTPLDREILDQPESELRVLVRPGEGGPGIVPNPATRRNPVGAVAVGHGQNLKPRFVHGRRIEFRGLERELEPAVGTGRGPHGVSQLFVAVVPEVQLRPGDRLAVRSLYTAGYNTYLVRLICLRLRVYRLHFDRVRHLTISGWLSLHAF